MTKEYLNNSNKCIVCFGEPEDNLNLIKHHISYFPERIAYVHFACHNNIHNPDKQLDVWIQYKPEDSKLFYKEKNKDRKNE